MITLEGNEILKDNRSHKFGRSGIAEFLYLSDHFDEECSSRGFYVARTGKRLLTEDCMGFVDVTRYGSVADAETAFLEVVEDLLCDVVCDGCDNTFESEEGVCWECGSTEFSERC